MAQLPEQLSPDKTTNHDQFLLECRAAICEAYYYDGPQAALMAVAEVSLEIAPLVIEGELAAASTWDSLQEVSENLTLVRIFGQDAVQEAIAFGMRVNLVRRVA